LRSSYEELDRMRREMDHLLNGYRSLFTRESNAGVFPLINVTEDKDHYYVRAELPGIKSDEIDISVTQGTLTISGERKIPAENESAKYHRREREAGKFNRAINLPGQIDTQKVEVKNIDGILTVTLPKAEALKPRKISIS